MRIMKNLLLLFLLTMTCVLGDSINKKNVLYTHATHTTPMIKKSNTGLVTSLQKVAESFLFGGGVYIGFKIAKILDKIFFKHLFGRNNITNYDSEEEEEELSGHSRNITKLANSVIVDLKNEQEELWRISHQIYTEYTQKISSISNATEKLLQQTSDIDNQIKTLEDVQTQILTKIQEESYRTTEIKEIFIPTILQQRDNEITQKIAKYIAELKILIGPGKSKKPSSGKKK